MDFWWWQHLLGGQCLYHKKGTAEEVAASDLGPRSGRSEMIGKGSRKAVVYHDTVGEMLYWAAPSLTLGGTGGSSRCGGVIKLRLVKRAWGARPLVGAGNF